jgi:hypothetical protein
LNLFVSDGRQFTNMADDELEPRMTIVTLAIRQADYIGGAMLARREKSSARNCLRVDAVHERRNREMLFERDHAHRIPPVF